MKIVQWDYSMELRDEDFINTEFNMLLGFIDSGNTNKPIGFFFRWICHIYTEAGRQLSCIGEDPYWPTELSQLSEEDLEMLAYKSFNDFKHELKKKLPMLDLEGFLSFEADRVQLTEFLTQLNRL